MPFEAEANYVRSILASLNSIVTTLGTRLNASVLDLLIRVGSVNSIRRFLTNELQYLDMAARYEQATADQLQTPFSENTSKTSAEGGVKLSSAFLANQRRRHASVNGGFSDCSALLKSGSVPAFGPENTVSTGELPSVAAVHGGVVNRYEYHGPPLPIDESFLSVQQQATPPFSACCYCRSSATSSSCCSYKEDGCEASNDRCETKYTRLQREIDQLKAQLARLTLRQLARKDDDVAVQNAAGGDDVITAANKAALAARQTTTSSSSTRRPPLAPPPPPPDFIKTTQPRRLPLVRAKNSSANENGGRCKSSSSGSPGGGGKGRDESALAHMTQVLLDLKSNRFVLKPVLKSPGGTPRKRTLAVYRKSCHDLFTEALKSKFANAHRSQRSTPPPTAAGVAASSSAVGASSLSDGDDSFGCSFEDSDSSWLDTPTKPKIVDVKKCDVGNGGVPNVARNRINTVS